MTRDPSASTGGSKPPVTPNKRVDSKQGASAKDNFVLAWCLDHGIDMRVIRYGLVGCVGIAANLIALAMLLRVFSPRSWVPSALANVVSTVINFVLHNLWTFADRRHQGAQIVRGLISFGLMSAVGVGITTVVYVVLLHFVAPSIASGNKPHALGLPLLCQFAAICVGAGVSYVLNRQFTWPEPNGAPGEGGQPAQAQEI